MRNSTVKRLSVLSIVMLSLALGGFSAQTQQPSDLTVKNLTVIETLTVAGVANLARGLEVVGVLRSKNDANLKNAAQLELDSSKVSNGRRYTLTATLGGLLELRDETAGVARLVIDANGQLKGSLDASSITSGTLSLSRLPLGDLDGRYFTQSAADSLFVNANGDRAIACRVA